MAYQDPWAWTNQPQQTQMFSPLSSQLMPMGTSQEQAPGVQTVNAGSASGGVVPLVTGKVINKGVSEAESQLGTIWNQAMAPTNTAAQAAAIPVTELGTSIGVLSGEGALGAQAMLNAGPALAAEGLAASAAPLSAAASTAAAGAGTGAMATMGAAMPYVGAALAADELLLGGKLRKGIFSMFG